jgi:hypothetical protein
MLKIFAKHGTDEKALVCCERNEVLSVQIALENKFGGNWIWVDKLDRNNREILLFNDGLKYLGYHGKPERYSNGIKSLNI